MSHTQVEMVSIPSCDLNPEHGKAIYDGKTTYGPWAYMCESCFQSLGVGLGLGNGQRLIKRSDK